jgi:HD-GYP domain-containing protein (c-di-GMP phosphodiesterase class II)
MVARIGGDEFAVLLPNSEEKTVKNACKRIEDAVAKHNAAGPELPLSISIGFAARSDASISMSDLFKEADNRMYREKLHRNQSARSAIVQTLLKTLEARDFITEEHAERIQKLIAGLAAAIDLSERSITDLRLLAQFHDIGKIGIPDSILLKPGPLDPEEVIEMQQHCEIGHRIAILAPDLVPIADWILKHHEWWNGQGYPLGIKGVEIPLECRILAIVDAYDAMTNDRPYRRAMSHEEALNELEKYAGIQFDPYLVREFIRVMKDANV